MDIAEVGCEGEKEQERQRSYCSKDIKRSRQTHTEGKERCHWHTSPEIQMQRRLLLDSVYILVQSCDERLLQQCNIM